MADRPNLKHAVEVVPMAITRALIEVCDELGYAQFVLHRRAEKDRLMSLYMAEATGAWGSQDAATLYPKLRSGALAPDPIDLSRVAERVRIDAACLGDTLMLLRGRGVDFGWLLFEEIYQSPTGTVQAALAIAGRMGLNLTETDQVLFYRDLARVPVGPATTVSDEDLLHTMRFVWERMKVVVEPTGVLGLAAAYRRRLDVAGGAPFIGACRGSLRRRSLRISTRGR